MRLQLFTFFYPKKQAIPFCVDEGVVGLYLHLEDMIRVLKAGKL